MNRYILVNNLRNPNRDRKMRIDTNFYNLKEHKEKIAEHINQKGGLGLIIPFDIVVIDIDNEKLSEEDRKGKSEAEIKKLESKLQKPAEVIIKWVLAEKLNCRIVRTSNGCHLYFKRPKTVTKRMIKKRSYCDVKIDYLVSDHKIGEDKDKLNYVVVPTKYDNKELIKDVPLDKLDPVPIFLLPTQTSGKGADFIDYPHYKNGNWNDSLLRMVYRLKANPLTPQMITDIILGINKYVAVEPHSEDRLFSTILRPDNLKIEVKKKFTHDEIADILDDLYNIRVDENLNLYLYNDGVFEKNDKLIDKILISVVKSMKDSMRTEVKKYLKITTDDLELTKNLVSCKNGYVLGKGKLIPHTDSLVAVNQVNFDYQADPKPVLEVDEFLDSFTCNKPERRKLVLQLTGYCMMNHVELQKMFLFLGNKGGEGKTTFLDLLMEVLGETNVKNHSLHSFIKSSFMHSTLDKRLANISPDGDDSEISSVEPIKIFTGGGRVSVDQKHNKDGMDLRNYATFVGAFNDMPNFKTTDMGLLRRLIVIRCEADPSTFNKNFSIGNLLHDKALSYFGSLALNEYYDMVNHRKVPLAHLDLWANKEENYENSERFRSDYNLAYKYIQEYMAEAENDYVRKDSAYQGFIYWCDINGENTRAYTFNKFTRDINKYFHTVTKENTKCWAIPDDFKKEEDNE